MQKTSELPQIHDWFVGLLTPGQWIAIWIVLFILTVLSGITLMIRKDEADFFGISIFLGAFGPFITWGILAGIGHFTSFMIWLWFGGVSG